MNTINELRSALQALFKSGLNMQLYLGYGKSPVRKYFLADLDEAATNEVCSAYVAGVNNLMKDEDLSMMELSQIDSRQSVLYKYDFADSPTEFDVLKKIALADEHDVYSFETNNLEHLESIAIRISSHDKTVVFFKRFYPVLLVKRDTTMLVLNDAKRFTQIKQDVLRVTNGFDLMLIDDDFYIRDFKKFEDTFGFTEIAETKKQALVTEVLGLNLINDSKGLFTKLNVSNREVIRAQSSPVLKVPKDDILKFVSSKEKQLKLKVKDGQIVLSSKESLRRFMKLLNDDILTSELTHIDYETLAKDKLQT
jgi:hypothetical protein